MRPKRLQLSGFTCFKDSQELDFASLDLFAIAGATGSGKSSLLDAIVFALYGQVPRTGRLGMSELISLGLDRMSVMLEVEVAGAIYRIARTAYRTQRTGTAQIERLEGDRERPLAEGIKAVNDQIKTILGGLEYDAFVQSVMLPQGEFARFLRSPPGDQRKILRDLLRLQIYERMRKEAEERRKHLASTVMSSAQFLASDYAEATAENLAALQATAREVAAALEQRRTEAADQRRALEVLAEQEAKSRELERKRDALARHEAVDIAALRSQLAAHRRAEPVLPLIEAALGRPRSDHVLGELAAGLIADRAAHAAPAAITAATADAIAETPAPMTVDTAVIVGHAEIATELEPAIQRALADLDYSEPVQVALENARETADQLAIARPAQVQAARAREQARTLYERACTAHDEAQEQLRTAQAAQTDAEEALETARAQCAAAERAHQAVLLREHLHTGSPCPVCTQVVVEVPAVEPVVELAQCRRQVKAAQTAAKAARDQARAAEQNAVAAQTTCRAGAEALAGAETQLADAQAAVARHLDALAAQSGPWPASWPADWREHDGSDAPEVRIRAALARAQQAQVQHRALGELLDAGRAAAAAGFVALAQVREAHLDSGARAILEQQISSWDSRRGALQTRILELETALAGQLVSAAELAAAQEKTARIEAMRDTLIAKQGELDSEMAALAQQIERAAAHRAEMEKRRSELQLYQQLATELRSEHFQNYILDRIFRELSHGASQRLFQLSSERYTLALQSTGKNKKFFVVDHDNARERRSADTLSGGETFLASLALALELSEQVQRAAGAVKLDSVFIDEGFGTLDAESLDIVARVIETLGSTDRMVGIITHIQELTMRMPARIEVKKHAAGSRFEVIRT